MKYILCILFLFPWWKALAQKPEALGQQVYEWLLKGDERLCERYVTLQEYMAYINQLEIESEEKDLMKIQALEEFPTTRQAYARSCREILEVYQLAKKEGYTFGFREVRFHPTDQRGNIGFLEVVYTAQFGKESTTDGLRVEIILTPNGWKIIDGFYEL